MKIKFGKFEKWEIISIPYIVKKNKVKKNEWDSELKFVFIFNN